MLKNLIPLFLILAALNGQASSGRPPRGSIEFGADAPPIQWPPRDDEQYRNSFINIAREVAPSVVAVVPAGELPPSIPQSNKQQQQQGLGSGIIVSSEGHILTNYHVVANSEELTIHLLDKTVLSAKIIGSDSLTDVALLQITDDIPNDLPVAYLGDSDELQSGDMVAAIGSPFGLTSSITSGIVSALQRRVGLELAYQNFIQTDAAINPGNSGGALVNLDGAVIGINTLIFSTTGGFMGIGLAIPINLAKRVMEDLVYEGRVIRGFIGVAVKDITPEKREELGVDLTRGALISQVQDNQPAQRAGLRANDIITRINDKEIENANDLNNIVAAFRPGETVEVIFVREGNRYKTSIEIAERTESTQPHSPAELPMKQSD
ncbi:trypsin-like peptidase domain-containing protein [Chitinispirillales bacterium ANBcel5]|uniref:S1C family serine protease n=1 Tax=Cellulosispirillum alkaliphilum TaxID=3039283 RepID=UPI002A50238F|nr:trypsin-like peptidase domain-containing protein [Chitinispirillales bacterium ANBcel5]